MSSQEKSDNVYFVTVPKCEEFSICTNTYLQLKTGGFEMESSNPDSEQRMVYDTIVWSTQSR